MRVNVYISILFLFIYGVSSVGLLFALFPSTCDPLLRRIMSPLLVATICVTVLSIVTFAFVIVAVFLAARMSCMFESCKSVLLFLQSGLVILSEPSFLFKNAVNDR